MPIFVDSSLVLSKGPRCSLSCCIEFFTERSGFFRTERTRLPRPVIQDVNAMRLDGDGEDLPAEIAPLNKEEAEALYGEVHLEYQAFYYCLHF